MQILTILNLRKEYFKTNLAVNLFEFEVQSQVALIQKYLFGKYIV